MVRQTGGGDAMGNPEFSNSELALVRFPLNQFIKEPAQLSADYYQALIEPAEGYTLQNRFVGDYFLYGTGSNWYQANSDNNLYVVNYKQYHQSQIIKLKSSVDRIEVINNNNAIVVGSSDTDLYFNWLKLDDASTQILDSYIVNDANQGETRSHGFSYSSAMNILGLPLRSANEQGYQQLYNESVEVIYLTLDNNKFEALGSLISRSEVASFNDACLYSCTDWYGNSRPIFYQGRIFALMGYELVEGEKHADGLVELQRTHLYRDAINRQ
jgi:hypothetical protein